MTVLLLAGCSDGAADNDEATIAEMREELLAYVIDIPSSDGHRYQATDDLGHEMDAAKIIQIAETCTAETQPLLDRAALFQGYRGSIGDRDYIEYEDHGFTFLESQFIQDDWRTFRILLYDDELGAQDRAGFPDAPAVPPSVHVFLHTHLGSSAFTNFTISEVTLDGHRALVMGVFIPQEGARGDEAGQLIYIRLLD